MRYIEAPNEIKHWKQRNPSEDPIVFLGGSIMNCPDWQQVVRGHLDDCECGTLVNPRRANFPMGDHDAGRQQIEWEYNAIWERADTFTMWFCKESIGPICLYELGSALAKHKGWLGVLIGGDPEYERRFDVEVQAELRGYTANFDGDLKRHAEDIRRCVEGLQDEYEVCL